LVFLSAKKHAISTCILFVLLYARDSFILYTPMAKKEKKLESKKEIAHDAPQKEDKVKKIEKKKKNDKSSKGKTVENKVIAKKIPMAKKEKATDQNKTTKKDPLTTISDFL